MQFVNYVFRLLCLYPRMHRQRQHLPAQPLSNRKISSLVAQVGICWLRVHRQRVIHGARDTVRFQVCLQGIAPAVSFYLNSILVKYMAAAWVTLWDVQARQASQRGIVAGGHSLAGGLRGW
jgi:hypothetical protein